jgi:hypothetical protein
METNRLGHDSSEEVRDRRLHLLFLLRYGISPQKLRLEA